METGVLAIRVERFDPPLGLFPDTGQISTRRERLRYHPTNHQGIRSVIFFATE
jgi:hypothetical protein